MNVLVEYVRILYRLAYHFCCNFFVCLVSGIQNNEIDVYTLLPLFLFFTFFIVKLIVARNYFFKYLISKSLRLCQISNLPGKEI